MNWKMRLASGTVTLQRLPRVSLLTYCHGSKQHPARILAIADAQGMASDGDPLFLLHMSAHVHISVISATPTWSFRSPRIKIVEIR